jgi:hypothetical protein
MKPKKVETWQIQCIHAALASKGLVNDKEYKAEQVGIFSNGRAISTKDLYYDEANAMLAALNKASPSPSHRGEPHPQVASLPRNGKPPKDEARDNKLKAVFSLMHRLKWYTDETINSDKPKLDYKRLNDWLVKYGHWHKILDGHKTDELSIVIFQLGEVLKGN